MMSLLHIILGITILFIVFLLLRSFTSLKICALCGAVSVTWMVLLTLLYLNMITVDPLLIGILMGGSIVGLLYLLERKLEEKYHLFKLPFYLSLISIVYLVLGNIQSLTLAIISLLILWLFFVALFILKKREGGLKRVAQKIIECCKNW